MSLKNDGTTATITCDKCQTQETATSENYNDKFFANGWCLNMGRKYMHLCSSCQTPSQRKAMTFVRNKFTPHLLNKKS